MSNSESEAEDSQSQGSEDLEDEESLGEPHKKLKTDEELEDQDDGNEQKTSGGNRAITKA